MATPKRGSGTRTRKAGTMNAAGTKKWDGKKWNAVNVKRDGQKATLNGKPVVRRGGKWVPDSKVGGSGGRKGGSKVTSTTKTLPKSDPKIFAGTSKAQQESKAAKTRTAAVKARAAAKAAAAKAEQKNRVRPQPGDTRKLPSVPDAPKLPPKPSATKTPPKPVKPKTTPKKSNASTYRDKTDTKGTSVGRYKTFKEHQAAVASAKLTKKGKNVGPVAHGGTYASAMKKKKDKK
jgi:hypothetical protein